MGSNISYNRNGKYLGNEGDVVKNIQRMLQFPGRVPGHISCEIKDSTTDNVYGERIYHFPFGEYKEGINGGNGSRLRRSAFDGGISNLEFWARQLGEQVDVLWDRNKIKGEEVRSFWIIPRDGRRE